MRRPTLSRHLLLAAALLALAGCGEKSQAIGEHPARKSDTQAWAGGEARYTVDGWKAGDRSAWEQQIKDRNLRQNEYLRVR